MAAQTSTDQTRQAILDAAEQLFARHGFDGTSIREITRAAGVNVAAVHYHFGSKEAVLRGVSDRVARPISARRTALLEQAVEAAMPQAPTVRDLVDAFVRADFEVLLELQERGAKVARFLGRTYSDQTPWIQEMASSQYREGMEFFPHLSSAVPEVSPSEMAARLRWMVAVIIHTFATWPEGGMDREDADERLAQLVTFITGGMAAPPAVTSNGR